MFKFIVCLLLLGVAVQQAYGYGELTCAVMVPEIPMEWADMRPACVRAVSNQIQMEINASYQYLAMAAYYSRDDLQRPGFAAHFFKAAREEREHGSKLIEYLSMRGRLAEYISDLITVPEVSEQEWRSGALAFEYALRLETKVTQAIRRVIQVCENEHDYHMVDYLTGVFLDEQLHAQRDMAGQLSTLKKLMYNHGDFGEFLFDKTL